MSDWQLLAAGIIIRLLASIMISPATLTEAMRPMWRWRFHKGLIFPFRVGVVLGVTLVAGGVGIDGGMRQSIPSKTQVRAADEEDPDAFPRVLKIMGTFSYTGVRDV